MQKLATYLVREGPFTTSDGVGWTARLARALAVIDRVDVAHGHVSAKEIRIADGGCESAGLLLEGEGPTGEIGYHSPERLAGGGTSPEDDTWAVGVVLYQVLTGALPFPGSTKAQVRAEILASHAVPLASRGVGDECLQRVVDDLFAPDPDGRLASLDELHQRLVACIPHCVGLPPMKLGTLDDVPADDIDDEETQIHEIPDLRPPRPRLSPAAAGLARGKQSSRPPRIFDMEFDELAEAAKSEPGQLKPDAGAIFGLVPPPAKSAPAIESQPPLPPPRPPPPRRSHGPPAQPTVDSAPELPVPPASGFPPPPVLESGPELLLSPASEIPSKKPWWILAVALAVVALAIGAWWALRGDDEPPSAGGPETDGPPATASSEPSATTSAPEPDRTAAASAAPTAAPTASATATAGAESPPPGAADLPSCMNALFPADTFAEVTPRFDFVCTETHARKGGTALKVEVVRTGGTPGTLPVAMQEWAKLGWYEMAVFAVARRRCCAEPVALATPLGIDLCPLDQVLDDLGKAAAGGDERAVAKAIDAYTKVAQCLVQAGASKAFGQAVPPTKAATEAFQAILQRAGTAK